MLRLELRPEALNHPPIGVLPYRLNRRCSTLALTMLLSLVRERGFGAEPDDAYSPGTGIGAADRRRQIEAPAAKSRRGR